VLWGVLRIAYVHLQNSFIAYRRHNVLINNLAAWGIPAIFATVGWGSGQIGYVTSHYCGPTLAWGRELVWIPVLAYTAIASGLQIWTLIQISRVRGITFISFPTAARLHPYSRKAFTNTRR